MTAADLSWLALPVAVAQVLLGWRRLLAYLRYFQQEGYDAGRFLAWTGVRSLTDPAFWLAVAAAGLVSALGQPTLSAAIFVVGAALLVIAQPDPRSSGKITLKMTWRAVRIAAVTAILMTLLWLAWLAADPSGLRALYAAAALVLAAAPLLVVLANLLLAPYEAAVQRGYRDEATARLARVAPFVIGITGSYGKSSAKAMLAHLLLFKAPTLAATGSINTVMGLTRHIREQLTLGHAFMVVEMGAYGIGSIRRLCAFTPPAAAMITAVGDMHLERFGSLENIVAAKGELAEALPPGGILVANADSPGALAIARRAGDRRVLLYGETADADLETRLEQVRFTRDGSHFVLRTRHARYEAFTPIHGRPIVLNLTGAFTMAVALGLDPEVAVAAMATLRPVANRLEVVDDRGITWLRDAYNSNQFGFRAALEVAAALPATRRVLVTPGVIELGPIQAEVNAALSREAAAVCDNTIVVSATNRAAFEQGHRAAGRSERLVPVASRTEAFRWIAEHVTAGDLVILENDLPDLYEPADGFFVGRGAGVRSGR